MPSRILTEINELDMDFVHSSLSKHFCSKSIPIEVLSETIQSSLWFGIYPDD